MISGQNSLACSTGSAGTAGRAGDLAPTAAARSWRAAERSVRQGRWLTPSPGQPPCGLQDSAKEASPSEMVVPCGRHTTSDRLPQTRSVRPVGSARSLIGPGRGPAGDARGTGRAGSVGGPGRGSHGTPVEIRRPGGRAGRDRAMHKTQGEQGGSPAGSVMSVGFRPAATGEMWAAVGDR